MKDKLVVIITVLLLVLSIVSSTATVTLAHTSPHEGTFTSTTSSCAGCHRAHTATAQKILIDSSQYNLCTSCHDGTGADTKVTTGVYLGTDMGNQNTGLRGGGFVNALMDTDADSTISTAPITSRHTVGGSAMTAWDSGGSGNGESVSLECGDCHNPHGNSKYRLLRPRPTSLSGWASLTPENVTEGTADNYTINYSDNGSGIYYRDFDDYTTGTLNKISRWCAQCHTRYHAPENSGNTSSGSSPFLYRHPTEKMETGCAACHNMMGPDPVTDCKSTCHGIPHYLPANATIDPHLEAGCLSCHVAHGTSANMTNNAAGPTWPDGTGSASWQNGTEGEYSRLLHLDNRGVCIQCHASNYLSNN